MYTVQYSTGSIPVIYFYTLDIVIRIMRVVVIKIMSR
jgi:hypothetical protein